mmetsp:Transcript_17817/g.38497  ORF Transcript_17817/g.38497 Transcript_17817/m.38497 type:complete len:1137 (-) Transcript_17817:266-3676(-)|eukprot:CAMPEP_0172301232 /NCGR_PEP_ID=MMETSP1058-20130122/3159_1 /TAXON_ID=83371 /ORGANISM="Detonula confervacea, Strain CCMP 353" /LENGTH=1136 /DNA_ID=CAMNT_0013011273 /DNA_START=17 /DNA_END=3427 /DNA_ORIENTATION=-
MASSPSSTKEEEREVEATTTTTTTTTTMAVDENEEQSITDIVHSHFDSYQHDDNGRSSNSFTAATRAAVALRHDLTLAAVNNDDSQEDAASASEQAAVAIVHCLDAAMSAIIAIATSKKKTCHHETVSSVLELAAAFACGNAKDDEVARAVITRAVEYGTVERDVIRLEGCKLLGLCVRYLMESSKPTTSILKKKKYGGGKKAVQMTATTNMGWKVACLLLAGKALLPRITDKIAKVRHAAISACSFLFSQGINKLFRSNNEEEQVGELQLIHDSIQSTLLWIMANDSSAGNRALVAQILPAATASSSQEKEAEENNNVQCIIERIKDVDVKVREAALDSLRENVHFSTGLTEDQRVEILRTGLTKRCPTTHAKTVELLCTNWLKSTKFCPISLLDQLNPVLNENVCVQASQILLRVASMIDCEELSSSVENRGVELVRKHFGGPEVRMLRQMVLEKRSIVPTTLATPQEGDTDDANLDEGEENDSASPTLRPSMALFLRAKCDISTNKSETISDIITDIPTLCNLLNSHIEKLIEFNNDEDYEDLDEDEAAAYEDDQNFICLQLIHMAKSSELQEEGSRRHFLSIMRRVLARLATPDDLVEACVKAMAAAHDKESQFLQTISEILVDVEDDDTFHRNEEQDEKAIVIVRQMRIIAILSIVLESISGQMTSHPILDGFFLHLGPSLVSKNAIVREHGVICLSKFCLLSGEDKVMEEFKPLLLTIAGSVEERVEVRAQAALALCDLALIHEKILVNGHGAEEEDDPSFKDMLLEMMGHAKPGIVIIAAEITAKLLLAGRLHDPNLIAWLLVIYFDTSLTAAFEEDNDIDLDGADVVKEVGSPVRLQQLLSIFFPTYSMSSLDANDDMMASVGPLLSIVNDKLSGMKKEAAKEAMTQKWPIAKMVEYVCYTVDLADKKKTEETCTNNVANKDEVSTVNGEQEVANKSEEDEDVEKAKDEVNKNVEEEIVEASSTLLASIDIAEFLSEECDSAPTLYNRALAKILASACIDVNAEDKALLRRLKSNVGEAEYANDDGPTVKSIKKLANVLVDVEDHDGASDEESVLSEESVQNADVDEEEEHACEEQSKSPIEKNDSLEKENPRLSVGSIKSTKQNSLADGGDRRSSHHRASLADVNCN